MTNRQLLSYLALALIWGGSFVLVLRVVEAFGWVGAVSLRAFIAAAVILGLARLSGRRLRFEGTTGALAVVGATTVAGQLIGISYATPRIGTAMAAIFVGAIPLVSMAIGHLWGVERVTSVGRAGLLLGFTGIVLLVGFPEGEFTATFLLGCAASVLGVVCAAIGSQWARRHLRAVGSWEQTIGAFVAGGLVTLPLLLLVPVPAAPDAWDLAALVVLAATCSSLAYVLYFRLVAEVGATLAVSVEFAVTLVAVAIGALLLGERLTPPQLAGGAIVLAGCALVLGVVPGLGPGAVDREPRRAELHGGG